MTVLATGDQDPSSASSGAAIDDATGDLWGGGVLIPEGTTTSNGMNFSGTISDGSTFSGTMVNQIGHGYTPIDGYGFINAEAAVTAALPAVQRNGVVSRKTHGPAGTFDINVPLTGTRAIECRSAGHLPNGATGDYQLVFKFATELTSVGSASVTTHNPTNATGSVLSSMIDPNDHHNYIVNLTNVHDAQYLSVTLASVAAPGASVSDIAGPQLGILLGDVTGNGVVTNTDVGSVKAQVDPTTPITDAKVRQDVSANGFVTNTDVGSVKAHVNPTGGLFSPP